MKLVDTTFLIDFLRKKENVKEKLEEMLFEPVYTARVNIFETLIGIYSIKSEIDRSKKLEDANILFNRLFILELSPDSTIKAAELGGKLNREGKTINPSDCLVAGIALSNGITTLITKNTKHFQDIGGLKVEGY